MEKICKKNPILLCIWKATKKIAKKKKIFLEGSKVTKMENKTAKNWTRIRILLRLNITFSDAHIFE